MTPEQQRAPIAFLTVHPDGRREVSLERPHPVDGVHVVELVDRELLMTFIDITERCRWQVREMKASAKYAEASRAVESAKDEVQQIDDLISALETRRDSIARALNFD